MTPSGEEPGGEMLRACKKNAPLSERGVIVLPGRTESAARYTTSAFDVGSDAGSDDRRRHHAHPPSGTDV